MMVNLTTERPYPTEVPSRKQNGPGRKRKVISPILEAQVQVFAPLQEKFTGTTVAAGDVTGRTDLNLVTKPALYSVGTEIKSSNTNSVLAPSVAATSTPLTTRVPSIQPHPQTQQPAQPAQPPQPPRPHQTLSHQSSLISQTQTKQKKHSEIKSAITSASIPIPTTTTEQPPSKRKKLDSSSSESSKTSTFVSSRSSVQSLETITALAQQGKQLVILGKYHIIAWYTSPYPEEIYKAPTIHMCEYSLQAFLCDASLKRYQARNRRPYPPGNEIYRKDDVSFFEVDGNFHTTYAQNLCLMSQLWLKHKTLHYNVEGFLFFVLVQWDDCGAHILGYFSKEKESASDYNLSCILTLPQHQRKGYGRLLIDFSYLLTKKEGKTGSPEKPLSDLGLLSYRSYWKEVLFKLIVNQSEISIRELSSETGIDRCDVVSTLQSLSMVKYWKGMHYVVKPTDLEKFVDNLNKKMLDNNYVYLDANALAVNV
eukprot:m.94429 g.94429  ORF g.94429 m.94429 type:complete len:481 (-) comp26720_c0_seq1:151-1593(-)